MLLLTPAFSIVVVLMFLVATGVIAVSFSISGIPFKLSASELKGTNFVQYATVDPTTNTSGAGSLVNAASPGSSQVGADGKTYDAATVTVLGSASLTDLDQVICAPIPGGNLLFGSNDYLKVELKAGTGGTINTSSSVMATGLTVDAPLLNASGGAVFTNINIGEDAGTALGIGANGSFSQAADAVDIHGLTQIAIGTSAGTFTLPSLNLAATFATSSC